MLCWAEQQPSQCSGYDHGSKVQRDIVISDLHIPFHDPFAWDLTLAVVQTIRPQQLVIAGDALDFWKLSVYDKDPGRMDDSGLQKEIDLWKSMIKQLQRATTKGCLYNFLPGNHEDRLRRYLWRHPELHGLRALDLPSLLSLPELNIGFHEHEYELVPRHLLVKHGRFIRKYSAYSARAELENERFSISTITGHTHRLGTHYTRTRRGLVKAIENGCLCSLEPGYIRNPDWQHGFTLVIRNGKDAFHAINVPYLGGKKRMKCIVMGQEVRQ